LELLSAGCIIAAMNRHLWKQQLTSYDEDYAAWCAEQGALLREGRLADLDRQNLAEEIESLGRSDRREIESRLKKLLSHLLKYKYQSEERSNSWRATIHEQRTRIARIIRESPSLSRYPAEALLSEYEFARWSAIQEAGLPEATFPVECPFSIEQILDPAFLPE
jgi:hypothetical protein